MADQDRAATLGRRDDAQLDAIVSAHEGRITGDITDPHLMLAEHSALVDAGVLDPDQPTPWSHHAHMEALRAEFTSTERATIRAVLGMAPSGSSAPPEAQEAQ